RERVTASMTVDVRRVSLCVSKRRLERKVLNHRAVLGQVLVDSIARSNHRLLLRFPCNPDARGEVVAVRPHERSRKYSIELPGLAGHHSHGSFKPRRYVQIRDAILCLAIRPVVLVARSEERRVGKERRSWGWRSCA